MYGAIKKRDATSGVFPQKLWYIIIWFQFQMSQPINYLICRKQRAGWWGNRKINEFILWKKLAPLLFFSIFMLFCLCFFRSKNNIKKDKAGTGTPNGSVKVSQGIAVFTKLHFLILRAYKMYFSPESIFDKLSLIVAKADLTWIKAKMERKRCRFTFISISEDKVWSLCPEGGEGQTIIFLPLSSPTAFMQNNYCLMALVHIAQSLCFSPSNTHPEQQTSRWLKNVGIS